MIQKLFCLKCSIFIQTKPFAGFKMRRTALSAQKPEGHGYETRGEFVKADALRCDNCNVVVHNGRPLVAVTQWRLSETEPEKWELKYGKESGQPSYSVGRA